jgi:hypothetical protein
MTEPYLTIAELEQRFPNEWVMLRDPRVNRRTQAVLGGYLLFHSGDRAEFDRLIRAVPPNTSGVMRHFASFYTGEPVLEEDVVEETEPQELRRAQ